MKRNFFLFALFTVVFFLSRSVSAQWEHVGGPYGNTSSLVYTSQYLFASCQYGVFRTSDNGASWSQTDVHDFQSLTGSGIVIYGGSFNPEGVFHSTDNGSTWIQSGLAGERVW